VPMPAGVSGNTSRDMVARLDRDILSRKPTWVAIGDSGGNDVWHSSVGFAEYMQNMTAIVERAQAAGIRVIVQTCTPIGEDMGNEFNPKMAYYNAFVRYLATQKKCILADMNAFFVDALSTKEGKDNAFTTDGVHMNERGDKMMATVLLRALGLADTQIAQGVPAG
jgi:lysophospholipase L1-like esterase